MGRRRTGPLIAAVLIGALLLVVRLHRVQIGQHEIWANEAANLVRSSRVVPYERGRIVDAEERVLARDVPSYRLVFRYRDFRRKHPLGQVAHAWSALLGRPVGLDLTLPNLESWASELVHLSPTDVAAFGEGAGLSTWRFSIAPLGETQGADGDREEPSDAALAARARRASDALFYGGALLRLDWSERNRLRKALRGDEHLPSLVELTASWRGETADGVLAELSRGLADATRALERLEERLAEPLELRANGVVLEDGAELVALLERRRRGVEDAIASRLFAETAGFAPGRLVPSALARFDLAFLARDLDWDGERLAAWRDGAHAEWLSGWRDGYALERLLVEIQGRGGWEEDPERALSFLLAAFEPEDDFQAALDGAPRDWREVSDVTVLDRLHAVLERGGERGSAAPTPSILALSSTGGPVEAGLVWAQLESGAAPVEHPMQALLARHRLTPSARSARLLRERLRELAVELWDAWDAELQTALSARLDALARAPDERFAFARDRQKRRNAKHWVKDYGSRPLPLTEVPDYEAVYLLTRYQTDYPGFEVEDGRTRVVLPPEDAVGGKLPAEALIGHVSRVDARDIQEQRELRKEVQELRGNARRSEAQDELLRERVAEMRLADEVKGASGVELGWDAELRGRNGFREYLSLEDIYGEGQGEDRLRPPEDGADVRLTLVTPVQMAAERVLARPERPESGSDELADAEGWFDEPVGAIVLMTVDGDVIAAASHALEDGDPSDPRARDIDRTLQKPAFQPPGSVFKPFVAAWALDRSGLDPLESFECAPGDDQYGEYKGLRCWRRWGHGPGIDLHAALLGSCNVYFAHLGERLSIADLRGAAQAFGFGGPTGIRGVDDRLGPLEHTVPNLFADSLRPGLRMRAANGLSVVEATPVQLARATAALATGYLPSVRIVDAIGGVPVARVAPTDLPLSEASLARVRRALVDVANAPGGTARDALSEEMLGIGLCVAVKTGSADLFARSEGQGSKHAWAAGWIPAEDPVLVFVVLCDTTDYTSSHSVVWVVRQLLREEAVRGWLAGRRVER